MTSHIHCFELPLYVSWFRQRSSWRGLGSPSETYIGTVLIPTPLGSDYSARVNRRCQGVSVYQRCAASCTERRRHIFCMNHCLKQATVWFCVIASCIHVIFNSYLNGTIHSSWRDWYHHIPKLLCGPFYLHGITLIPTWISNYIHCKVWDEITKPFLNFNGATVEFSEWIDNIIPYFTGHVITYSWWC